MKPQALSQKIETFREQYPWVGPSLWIASAQYFIVMTIVGMAWPTHYSILANTISDLGNTTCGIYAGRYVCSPWHTLMNASFILLGITMVTGSGLIYQEFKKTFASWLGFGLMGLGGIGIIMVGVYAEDTIASLHIAGAALPFVLGNLAILILGFYLDLPRWMKFYSFFTGIVSLTALFLFVSGNYYGLGAGGMERLAAHPQTFWLIVFGIYISANRYVK